MVIVSDTNILSSLAAADALPLLPQLFPGDTIHLPPAVEQELQTALGFGKRHVERVFEALDAGAIHHIELTPTERSHMTMLPSQLHAGEREGIVLCQIRKCLFLCNDRRAIRYCEANAIQVVDLIILLRLLWVRRIVTQDEVKDLIDAMAQVEHLTLSDFQRTLLFAPHPLRKRGRK